MISKFITKRITIPMVKSFLEKKDLRLCATCDDSIVSVHCTSGMCVPCEQHWNEVRA